MKRLCILYSLAFLSLVSGGRGQAPTTETYAEKLDSLRILFAKIKLDLPPQLDDMLSEHNSFLLLQDFADTEHQWATGVSQIPEVRWHDLGKESYPGGLERALRSTVIKTETIQQPKTVQIYDPTQSKATASLNPDHLLWKVSTTTDYSQLVPATNDVQTQATALSSAGVDLSRATASAFCSHTIAVKSHPVDSKKLKAGDFNQCVLRTGKKYMLGRIESGFKGTFTWVQNPHVFSGALVPAKDALDNNLFSGEVDFDPTKIFLTGSDWLAAYQSAALYGDKQRDDFVRYVASKYKACSNLISGGCVRILAGPHGRDAILAALVPTVTFVEKTNFDFASTNGVINANPYPSKRLADLTFTVDLTRLIPSAKARQDALTALVAANAKKSTPPIDPVKKTLDDLVRRWASKPRIIESDQRFYDDLVLAIYLIPPA